MKTRIAFLIAALVLVFTAPAPRVVHAQTGMPRATAKLLIGDLIDAGYAPTIREFNGLFIVSVNAVAGTDAPTAQQVQNFATARSVTARVTSVEFR